MGVGEAVIVAGIGCRRDTGAAAVQGAVAAALLRAGLDTSALGLIATSQAKGCEAGIAAAARALGVPLVLVPDADLKLAGARTVTHSARVLALTGVPSLAEAAALAAGGPAAHLILPRLIVGAVTCALAAEQPAAAKPLAIGQTGGEPQSGAAS